tara:strand:- start:9153 stop:11075 length:1923 start_codon:yes stop_codon:yes gene_type:complete
MTNSFSGGFQVFDQPIDTYVEAPREFNQSGAFQLAEVLQTVNPNLQKFIGRKVEKNRETERLVGKVNYLAENNAAYKNIAKGLKEKLGDRYGRIIQGNSLFVRQGIQEGKAENIGNGLFLKIKNNYNEHVFEDGTRLIDNEVESAQWQNWFQNALNTEIGDINDLDADVFEKKLMPKLTALSESMYEYDQEQKAAANLEKNRSLIAPRIQTVMPLFEKALQLDYSDNKENIDLKNATLQEAVNSLNNLTDSFVLNGYSGKDLKTLNNDLLENVVASVELFITNNPFDANTAQKAKDLLDLFGENVALGENRKLNQHPDWIEKSGELRMQANSIISNAFTVDEKLKGQVQQRSIDREYQELLKIEDYTERQSKFKSLYFKYPKYKTYIDNQARTDDFTTEKRLNDFKYSMSLNLFKNDQEMMTEFMSIEKSSLTDNDEIVDKLSKTRNLLTEATTIRDLVTKGIDKVMDDVQKILKPDAANYSYESQALLAAFEIEITEQIPSMITQLGEEVGNREDIIKNPSLLKFAVRDRVTELLNLQKLKMLLAIPNAKGLDGLKTNLVITDDKKVELGLADETTGELINNPYQQILIDNYINTNNIPPKTPNSISNIDSKKAITNIGENSTEFIPTEKMKTNAVLPD